ncbi:WAP four-disulfide core domain protein 12-like isoform X2 [Vombatus ursinus]|uniref:WAP four-disulfide core domain protein 12-like isoform X2 n=1 Tax=Vombatus ursinus TaxID=29139 RepID=UPI000FFD48C1|nr:WAP four-disulfide core domain protein 12-like isoform X2 [Vombatus ursinus]
MAPALIMKSGSPFFFLAFLALMFLTSSGSPNAAKIGKVRAGSCPLDNVRCFKADPPQCNYDKQCPRGQKCCYYHCGFKCVEPSGTKDPGTKKAGSCPDDPFRCIRGEPSECVGDEQCPQNQKCCYYHCGFKCVHPKETNNKD